MMINRSLISFIILVFPALALAKAPIEVSKPTIRASYGEGTSQRIIYTVTNRTTTALPIVVSGISTPISRTTAPNDCGSNIAAKAICNIGILISPTSSNLMQTIKQTLLIGYGGREPKERPIYPLNSQGFNVVPAKSYITDLAGNDITLCSVNTSNGTFSNCSSAGTLGFNFPLQMVFNSAGTRAYVTHYGGEIVYVCSVDPSTGLLSNCVNSGASVHQNSGIALNATETQAYITSILDNSVTLCSINALSGQLQNCGNSGGAGFSSPVAITLNLNESFAYVTNDSGINGFVSLCSINPNGTLSNCSSTETVRDPNYTALTYPISYPTMDTRAYVATSSSSQLCSILPSNGSFSNCNDLSVGFAISFTFTEDETRVYSNAGTAISICPVNTSTGSFEGCIDSGITPLQARNVVFQ